MQSGQGQETHQVYYKASRVCTELKVNYKWVKWKRGLKDSKNSQEQNATHASFALCQWAYVFH